MPQTTTVRSSGDFRADRRYEYARAAFEERDFEAAADLARQVIELTPGFAFLAARPSAEADLVVAADVFVYMAALDAAFREAHRVLKREGFFAFTVQAHEGDTFILGEDARYAHSEAYLRELADAVGFTMVIFERVSTREDRGVPVPGFLVVLQR